MAIREVLKMGDPRLLAVSEPVAEFGTPELEMLITDMQDTMRHLNGAGLAAPQIGVGLRVVIFGFEENPRYPEADPVPFTVLINPQLTPLGDLQDEGWEGCLSVPGESFPTGRAKWARVTGLGADGQPVDVEGTGLFARMLQHETGHLDGFLYLDCLIGRHARAAKRSLKSHGWGVPGLSWLPGEGPDPFGH